MTPHETLAFLRALTDPTPKQLREASDLALLAIGWEKRPEFVDTPFGYDERLWFEAPDGRRWRLDTGRKYPHPCASIDDAVRWMVPEVWTWEGGTHRDPGPLFVWIVRGPEDQKRPEGQYGVGFANIPALALTIAGLAATIEGKK